MNDMICRYRWRGCGQTIGYQEGEPPFLACGLLLRGLLYTSQVSERPAQVEAEFSHFCEFLKHSLTRAIQEKTGLKTLVLQLEVPEPLMVNGILCLQAMSVCKEASGIRSYTDVLCCMSHSVA